MSRVCATRQSSSYVSGAHRKRIAQVQVVNVGRARASDWSGSAATGREPPSNPWRGIMATGVARTGETRDAVGRARPRWADADPDGHWRLIGIPKCRKTVRVVL